MYGSASAMWSVRTVSYQWCCCCLLSVITDVIDAKAIDISRGIMNALYCVHIEHALVVARKERDNSWEELWIQQRMRTESYQNKFVLAI